MVKTKYPSTLSVFFKGILYRGFFEIDSQLIFSLTVFAVICPYTEGPVNYDRTGP